MKFRFCGEQDCPDWLLAEIVVLTKITSIKMKLLTSSVVEDILGTPLDYDKVTKYTSDAKLEQTDVKACIACLLFIINNAAKYGVEENTLSDELQQLGLPKENAASLCKAYGSSVDKLQTALRDQVLTLWKLENVDWRLDYILSSSALQKVNETSVHLKLDVKSPSEVMSKTSHLELTTEKFQLLLNELKQAEAVIASMTSS